MKKIIASLLITMLLLVGCGEQKHTKKVIPYSETYSVASENLTSSSNSKNETVKSEYTVTGGTSIQENEMPSDVEEYIEDAMEGSETPSAVLVEKNTQPKTLDTKWQASATADFTGGAELEADEARKKILNTKNTADYYNWTGKTFYVSPDGNNENDGLSPDRPVLDLNADAFYLNPLKPGDAVLFERGGLWRMSTAIRAQEGVIYGSYGTGEKPTLYGSVANYADPSYWIPSKIKNVWKLIVSDYDIGLIVFNHGEAVGFKKLNGLTTLEKNFDYYFNSKQDAVYLYCDKGNPGSVFKDIEVGYRKAGFSIGKDNVVIDNFRIKYYGSFGISMANNNNTTITNCEIGFIGGAIQEGTIRYGNGIQQWNSVDGLTISNNWVYQTYDTAITWQGNDEYNVGIDADGNQRVGNKAYYKNITFSNNLTEYNIMDYEFWHGHYEPTKCQVVDYKLENNIMRYSGYGWSAKQRPDFGGWAFCCRKADFVNSSGISIKNNIFDCSAREFVYWLFSENMPKPSISGNTFYQRKNSMNEGMAYGKYFTANNQKTLESAVNSFDSNPSLIKWID